MSLSTVAMFWPSARTVRLAVRAPAIGSVTSLSKLAVVAADTVAVGFWALIAMAPPLMPEVAALAELRLVAMNWIVPLGARNELDEAALASVAAADVTPPAPHPTPAAPTPL